VGNACLGGAFPVYLFGIFSVVIKGDFGEVKTLSFFGRKIASKVGVKYLFFSL